MVSCSNDTVGQSDRECGADRAKAPDQHFSRLFVPNPNQRLSSPAGSLVTILSISLLARPLIEGQAELIAAVPELPGVFEVRFVGEARPVRRFIGSGLLNHSPQEALADLSGHWRIACAPELILPDRPFGEPNSPLRRGD